MELKEGGKDRKSNFVYLVGDCVSRHGTSSPFFVLKGQLGMEIGKGKEIFAS